MRRNALLRLVFGGASATLAIGLLAGQAPVSQASASPSSAGRAQARRAPAPPTVSANMVLARMIAAERARLRWANSVGGVITGFVKSPGGAPFAGACVTAASQGRTVTAASRSDGRYLLANLRPGRYRLTIGGCEPAGSRTPLSVFWPHPLVAVTVLGGQKRTLPPAFAWRGSQYGPVTGLTPARSTSRTGSISGRVTGNGRPLAGICAIAVPTFTYPLKGPQPRGTTSKTGRYRIRGLRPGQYLVVFRTGLKSCPDDANWLPQWYPYLNSPYPPDQAANVRVRASRDTANINGRLKLGAEITGVVRTKAGHPIRGICVGIFSFFAISGSYSASVASVSRRGGRYALHGLFPGSYQVQFSIGCGTRGNFAPQWWRSKSSPENANSIKVRARQTVRGINASLLPGAAITGTVRAKTARAAPIAGICVFASQSLGNGAGAVTAANGTYRLDGLFGGKTQVLFDPTCNGEKSVGYLPTQRSVTVKAGRTRAGVNASLHLAAGISGIITGPGGKPADPCVTVNDKGEDSDFFIANGHYLINGVPPGKYTVFFDAGCDSKGSLTPQWFDNKPDSGSANLVTFTAGKISRLNVRLRPGGTVTAVLRTPAGKPVSGDCVDLLSPQSQFDLVDPAGEDMTDDNGRVFFPDLAPGEYQLAFGCGYVYRFPSVWFMSKPDSNASNYLAVNAGVTTTVNEVVGGAGIIKGKVTDMAGRPIPDICVNVADAKDGQFVTPFDSGAMTDHGRYQVGQLAPGRYLVQFTDCFNGVYGSRWYRGKNSESFATAVTVKARQATTGVNGVLTTGGTISGRVTAKTGTPASDTCVSAVNTADGLLGDFGGTGTDGRYTVSGLASGRYQMFFYACDPGSPNLASITRPGTVRVVAPKTTTGVNVSLAAGGTIAGTVTGDSAEPGPQSGACVLAVPTDPAGSFPLTWTDSSGRYVLDALAAGTYRVYFDDRFCDNVDGLATVAPQWFSDQPDQPSANLVTVRAGQTVGGISATLRPYGAIEGMVTSATGARVTGECVAAVPVGATADPATGLAPTPDIAITQPTGRFRLLDLTPGQYKIEFSTGCGATGFATQWWPGATSAKSAHIITVRSATITGINAKLHRS